MANESSRLTPVRQSTPRNLQRATSPMLNYKVLLVVWLGFSVAISGCGSSEEHAEDEHLEHFVPAHKPANFAALVEQLEKRIVQQTQLPGSGKAASETAQSATERQELLDIIGWIPELAADSEMQKKNFETAVSAGARLGIALGIEKPSDGTPSVEQTSIPKLLEELKALVSKSQTSTEPM